MDIFVLLSSSSLLVMKFKYLIVFLGMMVEGPVVMVASGFLYRLGTFDLLPLFAVLFLGDLFADVVWYYVGYFSARPFLGKFGKFFGFKSEHIDKVSDLFHKYKSSILLLSKLTIGFGLAILVIIFAGMSKISMKTFLFLNAVGQVVIVSILLAVGYFLGNFYESIDKGYKVFTLIMIFVVIIAMAYGFSRYSKNKLIFEKI